MDIFRFNSPTSPTLVESGEIVNGFDSKMWIERYDKAGEFEFTGKVKSGLIEALPIGSLISHIDSTEVMVVENHEISESRGEEASVLISGRGFETLFEARIVGSNKTFPIFSGSVGYSMSAGYTWNQVVTLLRNHIYASSLIDDDDAIPYTTVLTDVTGTGSSKARSAKAGDLYSAMLELLAIDSLGIKVVRPGPWSPLPGGGPNLAVLVHKGVDRTADVVFSYDTGEIESADYLWSNKRLRNSAFVYSTWMQTCVDLTATGYDRRMLIVDAKDIDAQLTFEQMYEPSFQASVVATMQRRGLDAISAHNLVELEKAEVSKNVAKAGYRKDFEVGDLITVSGDYSTSTVRRISEYVEIEDKNGSKSYPTLTTIEES